MGETKQSAIVYSNDPLQPSVTITLGGTIKSYISMQPSPRVVFNGYYGDQLEQVVRITSNLDEPLGVSGVSSNIDDKIEYSLKTEKKDKEYTLTIRTRGGMQETFRGKIVLKTTFSKKPEAVVHVIGTLKKQVKVTPEYVYFGIIDTSKEKTDGSRLERSVVISQPQSQDLTITKIETSKEWITAATSADQPGNQHTITINLDKKKVPPGKFRETVTVHTQSRGRNDSAAIIVEGKAL